ncbi:Gfo/Idh/MocA family oxidoreductase (plasmid) [Sphingobium sp. JS3065]|uniref:Gfo/Idh/MocA family protein n=1 Tax=Sphingobium sp. JS3065 TaxID=2970925 RepID=UPI0022643110|nr:Gfo/Idh/MocA family oxidoreductase [Sphingobium sp. JS3065]UZW58281.1 Gfo/Idh/MocA family oxidoreductase [Sphingobium sp. JS3065]
MVHRVGIIGGSIDAKWGKESHLPAALASPNMKITAVSTRSMESATRSAEALGALHAFDNADALAACPDVDLVIASVRSNYHIQSVQAALDARKPVWCEWPFGRGDAESLRVTETAERLNLPTIAGLQGRFAPGVAYARQLIDEGYLGELRTAAMYLESHVWAYDLIAATYTLDERENANVLSIKGGHSLDMLTYLAGDVVSVAGTVSHLQKSVFAKDLAREVEMSSPDQFAAIGRLSSGAVFSTHITGAAPRGMPFSLHLVGDKGQLILTTDGMPEMAPLTLSGSRGSQPPQVLEIPAQYFPEDRSLVGPAIVMACAYRALPDDLSNGAAPLPDFRHGLKIQALTAAIAESSRDGIVKHLA